MGEVEVRIKVKDNVVETFHKLTQANPIEVALANSSMEVIKLQLLHYFNKLQQKKTEE